jgi:hypothetical protein
MTTDRTWYMFFPGSPSFKVALANTLARQASEHGIDLARGFVVMPLKSEFRVRFTDDGIGYFNGDLVGPDGVGESVRIAWMDARTKGTAIDPEADVSGDPDRVEGWWDRFPAAEELVRYQPSETPPFAVEVPDGWQVTWEAIAWPDLILRIELDREPADRDVVALATAAWRDAWHLRDEGTIHNWRTQWLGPRTVQIRVDFGSAPHAALGSYFHALDAAALPIARVTVSGLPAD